MVDKPTLLLQCLQLADRLVQRYQFPFHLCLLIVPVPYVDGPSLFFLCTDHFVTLVGHLI